jgi:hypothetical protein
MAVPRGCLGPTRSDPVHASLWGTATPPVPFRHAPIRASSFIGGCVSTGALWLVAAVTPWLESVGPYGWFLAGLAGTFLLAWAAVPIASFVGKARADYLQSSGTAQHGTPPPPNGRPTAVARAQARISDPRPRESDKDKEAKDAIIRFCRTNLYELIEQERRCVNLIIRELLGDDPQNTIVGKYAEKAIKSEFNVEPRIVAATKDSAYRESYTRIQLEDLLAEANELTVERSIFISQALRERGFDRRKAIQIATELCKAREAVKTAWAELAGNPIYDTFQTTIGQSESSWGHIWMPPTSWVSAEN